MNTVDLSLLHHHTKYYQNNFLEVKQIGKGGFSSVYEVINKVDQCKYALKQVDLEIKEKNIQDVLSKVMREARFLASLNHQNIIRYYSSWIELKNDEECTSPSCQLQTYNDYQEKIENRCDGEEDGEEDFEEDDDDQFDDIQNNQQDTDENTHHYSENFERNQFSKKSKFYQRFVQSDRKMSEDNIQKLTFFIQTELCENTLDSYISLRNEELRNEKKKSVESFQKLLNIYIDEAEIILKQIIDGLIYIHEECKLVHRDLKPANIFMNSIRDVKIGDFGLVKKIHFLNGEFSSVKVIPTSNDCDVQFEDQNSEEMGTALYRGPEQFDQRMDIYSLGVIIFQLYHPMTTQMELIKKLEDAKKQILPDVLLKDHPKISEIIKQCLSVDVNERPSLYNIKLSIQLKNKKQLQRSVASLASTQDSFDILFLGTQLIQFENDEEAQSYFCIIENQQLLLHENKFQKKAKHLYNLKDCRAKLNNDKNILDLEHSQLQNLKFIDVQFHVHEIIQYCQNFE